MRRQVRACGYCHVSLAGRKSNARWCSKACRTYTVRIERRAKAMLARPRCMICGNSLPYGKSGFNLRATTCSKACHIKRQNWFMRKSRVTHVHRPNGPVCRFNTKRECDVAFKAWQDERFEELARFAADRWEIGTRDRMRDDTKFGMRVKAIHEERRKATESGDSGAAGTPTTTNNGGV